MVTTNRKIYIDVVAGIMIFWMIWGHCSFFSHYGSRAMGVYKFLSFYMPWFFYKSGSFFFFLSHKDLLRKDLQKYIKPFLVYSIIGWSVWSICGLIDGSRSMFFCLLAPVKSFYKAGNIAGNGALWFLLSLFFVRQIGNVCLHFQSKQSGFKWIVVLTIIISFSLAFLLFKVEWYNHSAWFGNMFTGLFFFLFGYLFKNIEQNKWVFLVSVLVYASCVISYFTGIINDFPYLYMHANRMYRGNYLLFFPMAVAGIIMTNNVFRFLCKRVRFRILEYIGRNSMKLYVTHWVLFTIVMFVAKHVFNIESAKHLFYILLMSSILCLPLISKLIDTIKSKNKFFGKIL